MATGVGNIGGYQDLDWLRTESGSLATTGWDVGESYQPAYRVSG
jgi:hypothetical protein